MSPPSPLTMTDKAVDEQSGRVLELPKMEQVCRTYELHSNPDLEAKVREGTVVIAKLHVFQQWSTNLCFARSSLFPCDVVVNRPEERGEALHGDVVAIELLPLSSWQDRAPPQAADDEGAGDDNASLDDGVTRTQAMPNRLPNGRPIVRVINPDAGASTGRCTMQLRFHREIGGPEKYEWPEGKGPTGRVVAVLHRAVDRYHVGRVPSGVRKSPMEPIRSSYLYRFTLYNPLFPMLVVAGKDIPLPFHDHLEQHLFLLRLKTGPDGDVVRCLGGDMLCAEIQCSLGTTDSITANTAAICSLYHIQSDTFPAEVEALVPDAVDIPATAEGVAALGRRDLRNEEFVCTIDPASARDLDDALSIRRAPNGGYHVGVHIADVSYFVTPGTALDEEARRRLTSTYFVNRVVPMLPRKLSEDHCSLNPNEDKYAFSSLFEIDKEGHVVSEWFGRSVIRSRCRLAYEEAQQIIDGKDVELSLAPEANEGSGVSTSAIKKKVFDSVKLLFELASKRRKESIERGRLTVDTLRLEFLFEGRDSSLPPRGFFVKHRIQANWVVEEFMLLANNRTAEKIVQFLPDGAMLRNHLPVERRKLCALKAALDRHNIPLKGSSAKMLQETLNSIKDNRLYNGVCELFKLSLQAAEYFANDSQADYARSHFALGLPWYTHFTSPIRRYCDVMAHRQLLVAVELEQLMKERGLELPSRPDLDIIRKPGEGVFDFQDAVSIDELHFREYVYPRGEVDLIAEDCNTAKDDARKAGEMSVELFFCVYLQALFQKAKSDPRIRPRQFVAVVIVKLTPGSVQLFAGEIALSVQVGVNDKKQRFIAMKPEKKDAGEGDEGGGKDGKPTNKGREKGRAVDGRGREIDLKAKAAQRRKGGKATMPDHRQAAGRGDGGSGSGNANPTTITVGWMRSSEGQPEEMVYEDWSILSELVVELVLSTYRCRTQLDMIVLPPWEREAYLKSGARIPTSLEEQTH